MDPLNKYKAFWADYPDAEHHLAGWFKIAKKATWQKWADVQRTFPKASFHECCLIFNIRGNAYCLVVRRSENWKTLYVVAVCKHAEYDRGEWRKFCHYRSAAMADGGKSWRARRTTQNGHPSP